MIPRDLPENIATNGVVSNCWEINGHYIEVQNTIFGGRRITIREVGSECLLANWCAGQHKVHADTLISLAKKCVESDIDYPFCSKIKPYFNDRDFLDFMDSQSFIYAPWLCGE